jgi:thioredoxin 1
MSVLEPFTHAAALRVVLAPPHTWLVACFCAAWCDTCQAYRPKFQKLSQALPQHVFAWIDIEDHPELLGDEDVENFPTVLVQIGSKTVFYGPLLPNISHLEKLLKSLGERSAPVPTTLPEIRALLAK